MRLGRLERTGQGAPSTRTCSPPGSLHSPTPVIPGSPGHRRATHRGTMGLPALAGCQPHPATWACWGRGAPSSAAGPGLKQGRRSRCPAGPAQPWSGRKGHCPSPQGSPGSRAAEDAQGTDGRRRWRGTKEGKPCWKRRRTQVPALHRGALTCPHEPGQISPPKPGRCCHPQAVLRPPPWRPPVLGGRGGMRDP